MPSQTTKPRGLAAVTTEGPNLPARIIYHAVEGLGKTSFGAEFPKPLFLQASGETGLETLIHAGQVKPTPHLPEITTWTALLDVIRELRESKHDYETIVFDTLNGFERILHEHVCRRDFCGEWGEKGFASYQKGYTQALTDWREFLWLLDAMRSEQKLRIVLLCHSRITKFANPDGPDYDRYEPDLHKKTWGLTHKWADIVFFGNYFSVVDKDGKGKGGIKRLLYTQRTAAYDAKNRHGLPVDIDLGATATEGYNNFVQAMQTARLQSTIEGE